MSVRYRLVQWTPFKRRYDLALAAAIVAYVLAFAGFGRLTHRDVHRLSDEITLIRAFGTAAIILLHVALCIGPLARLNRRFLPLLYNRRHLGVVTFLVASVHAVLAVGFYHGFGTLSPLKSLVISNLQYRSLSGFPFEILGLVALAILFAMAATSHDFWLKKLTPRRWKSIHMLVYVAYTAAVLHVATGALQAERNRLYAGMLLAGAGVVSLLHLLAGVREVRRDRRVKPREWVDGGAEDDLREGHGRAVATHGGERVAVFRHGGHVYAVSNVCAHQGGPLGEGRVLDGCITCPWHGYQYRPQDGCSPPPFTEKLSTFRVRIDAGRIWIDPTPTKPEATDAG